MDKRWILVDVNGALIRPLSPSGISSFTETRDTAIAMAVIRRKLSTDLLFVGDDYDYFKAIERRPSRRCDDLYVKHQFFCDGKWKTHWEGVFTVGSGTWDDTRCTWSVRPDTNDNYTCILKNLEGKVNILQIASQTVNYQSPAEVEFVLSDTNFNGFDSWTYILDFMDGFGCTLYLNWRERTRTYCVSGSPSAPSTAGWTLLVNNCSTLGYADYVRTPTTVYSSGTPTAGTWVSYANNIANEPDDTCNWKRVDLQGAGCVASETESLPYYICFDPPVIVADEESIPRARPFGDCMQLIFDTTGCGMEVSSDFFEFNAAEDAPGFVTGDNYVTGAANQMNNMFFFQLSDVLTLTSNAATVGDMSLKQFLQLLAAWRCFWFIDEQNRIRVEHFTYFLNQPITSLLTYTRTEGTARTYLKAETPRIERLAWLREVADHQDFKGSDIIYDSACAANIDPSITAITTTITDIDFVRGPANGDIPKQRFLLVACDASDNIILDVGAISNEVVPNAPLSTANLFDAFWTWDRLLPSGTMNGAEREFDGYVPNVEQSDLSVLLCCDTIDINLQHRMETTMGGQLNDYAYVHSAEWNNKTNRLSIKARYKR